MARTATYPEPRTTDPSGGEERIAIRAFQRSDALELVGCAFGAFGLTWLIYERLTPLSGGIGFLLIQLPQANL